MSRRRAAAQPRKQLDARAERTRLRLAVVLGLGLIAVPLAFDPRGFDSFALPHLLALAATALLLGILLAWQGLVLPGGRLSRIAMAAALLAAVGSLVAAQAPYTAILGNEGYRHGVVAYLGLAVIGLAAMAIARDDRAVRLALAMAAIGILLSAAYAFLQWRDLDPVGWSSPPRAVISTAGNQNDLAAYSVAAIALAGPFLAARSRWLVAAGLAMAAVAWGLVVLSESRAGLVAVAAAVSVWIAAAFLFAGPAARKRSLLLGATAFAVCAPSSLFLADEPAPVAYIEAATNTGGDAHGSGISARVDIWESSLAVFRAHPQFGVGPGGLYTEFPRHQLAGLGFPFDRPTGTGNDPLVASPHNIVIEAAVAGGLAGLVALGTFAAWLLFALLALLRSRWVLAPSVAAGLAGFAVMALLNPLPLGALSLVAALLGLVAGRGPVATVRPPTALARRSAAVVLASIPLLAAVTAAALATVASRETGEAIEASAALRDASAASHASRAAALAPFEASVRRIETGALWNQFVASHDRRDLEAALHQVEELLDDYPGLASDYLRLARFRYALGLPGVDDALDRARQASPHGEETGAWLAAFPGEPSGD